jgi:hypothetical protein
VLLPSLAPPFYPHIYNTGGECAAVPLKGDVTQESIEELLKAEKLPTVIEFTDKNSQKIFSAGIERQVGGGLHFSPLNLESFQPDYLRLNRRLMNQLKGCLYLTTLLVDAHCTLFRFTVTHPLVVALHTSAAGISC